MLNTNQWFISTRGNIEEVRLSVMHEGYRASCECSGTGTFVYIASQSV